MERSFFFFSCQIAENQKEKEKIDLQCIVSVPDLQDSYELLKREVTSMKVSTLHGIVKPPVG
jgi:hypothetical protein